MAESNNHIVMIPFPGQGHVSPMMRLACKLVSFGGIRITYVAHQSLVKAALGSREKRYENVITVVSISEGAIEPRHWKGSSNGFVVMEEASLEMEKPLEELLRGMQQKHRIFCLIGDSFLALVQDVANRLGIPRVALWTASGCSAIPNFLVKDLKSNGFIPVQERIAMTGNTLVQGMPGLGKFTVKDLPFAFHDPNPKETELRIATVGRVKEATCILMSTFDELEGESVDHIKTTHPCVFSVGPLLPTTEFLDDSLPTVASGGIGAWEENLECLQWLDKQQASSVVYISFGSLANLSVSQLEELAMGLEASQAPFLWVIRPNLVQGASGESPAFQGFLDRTKSRGMIIPWAPQLQVLAHPAISVFLTHCGWNSTMESICCGVPLLAWPCFAEQNVNARYVVEDWKIGLSFQSAMERPGAFVKRDEVEQVIRRGVVDGGIKNNLKNFHDKAKLASSPGGSSYANLKAFIHRFCTD